MGLFAYILQLKDTKCALFINIQIKSFEKKLDWWQEVHLHLIKTHGKQ